MASDNAALSPFLVVNTEDPSTPRPSSSAACCVRLLGRGADGQITLRENTRAFEDIYLRPRSAEALADCDMRVSVTL